MSFIERWTEEDLTPWYNGLIHPPRPGLYLVRLKRHTDIAWGEYHDQRWRLGRGEYSVSYRLPLENLEWRGLTETAYRARTGT